MLVRLSRLVLGLGVGLMCLPATPAQARDIKAETSAYGSFVAKSTDDGCVLSFKHENGKVSPLFSVEGCTFEGLGSLTAVEKLATLSFPLKAPSGDEFHLFEIPTARGGNACDGSDYYVVVIRDEVAWATTSALGDCATLEQARVQAGDGKTSLILTIPPTTQAEGMVYTVTLGKLTTQKLAKKSRSLKETRTITVTGTLESGARFSQFLPYVQPAKGEAILIHAEGRCALDKLENSKVELKATRKTFSDGDVHHTCLSISAVK